MLKDKEVKDFKYLEQFVKDLSSQFNLCYRELLVWLFYYSELTLLALNWLLFNYSGNQKPHFQLVHCDYSNYQYCAINRVFQRETSRLPNQSQTVNSNPKVSWFKSLKDFLQELFWLVVLMYLYLGFEHLRESLTSNEDIPEAK
jgi:hypothetical protein